MSEVRVNNIVDYGGKGAPTFDNGAVISGVSSLGNQAKIGSNVTITSGGINVSGVTTAATLSGNLTGDVNAGFLTATSTVIGSGVTINSGGLNITGVMTATTFEGDGSSMTGVAMTIAPMSYNPDVNDSIVTFGTGIGITFDHRILAGSGNITLSIATNAGAAGTVVENFGVGSSVTIQGRKASIDPTNDLDSSETYHINYPSGCFTNTSGDVSYVGTAYTFGVKTEFTELFKWGRNERGPIGINLSGMAGWRSSPTQIPGTAWRSVHQNSSAGEHSTTTRNDGTMWVNGYNIEGELGLNDRTMRSSPTQLPGTTWSMNHAHGYRCTYAIKTDGTLWAWGNNSSGRLGQNSTSTNYYSSPVQVPGTDWPTTVGKLSGGAAAYAIKSDGTLWVFGSNPYGVLGNNSNTQYSSPVQVPGTTWSKTSAQSQNVLATKTDGTLWTWGRNQYGALGLSDQTQRSSPTQIPGTTWSDISTANEISFATKTDGTLWAWGLNTAGALGQNGQGNPSMVSSPTQIPGTTWSLVTACMASVVATKTDGTLWAWGQNDAGQLGLNSRTYYSSPVQVSGTTWSQKGHHHCITETAFGVMKVT